MAETLFNVHSLTRYLVLLAAVGVIALVWCCDLASLMAVLYALDVRYAGQSYELTVPMAIPLDAGAVVAGVDAELAAERLSRDAAFLELQDELADQPLVLRRRQCPVNRQPAFADNPHVVLDLVEVLVVRALEMAERGDARADAIGRAFQAGIGKPVAGADALPGPRQRKGRCALRPARRPGDEAAAQGAALAADHVCFA